DLGTNKYENALREVARSPFEPFYPDPGDVSNYVSLPKQKAQRRNCIPWKTRRQGSLKIWLPNMVHSETETIVKTRRINAHRLVLRLIKATVSETAMHSVSDSMICTKKEKTSTTLKRTLLEAQKDTFCILAIRKDI
ncbi:unnamed protein product, partial [Heterotrigona itama]